MTTRNNNSGDILYAKKRKDSDECYTPAYAVTPILEYIPEGCIVWCPFDKEESEFVKQIRTKATVIRGHIDEGLDFFEYEPENYDMIISNPPFSNKREFFKRALSLNKPFAFLMTSVWLNDAAPLKVFNSANVDLQLLFFNKRIQYMSPDGIDMGRPPFSSAYFCSKLLPKQIIYKEINADEK